MKKIRNELQILFFYQKKKPKIFDFSNKYKLDICQFSPKMAGIYFWEMGKTQQSIVFGIEEGLINGVVSVIWYYGRITSFFLLRKKKGGI